MTIEPIYKELVAAGMTREGACGMMGNMMAESSMIPNVAQRGMTKLTDAQYTAAADNGLIDFANDSVGYGLLHRMRALECGQNLLNFAKSRGMSVGGWYVQVEFCLFELRYNSEYAEVWAVLTSSHDLRKCSDIVCTKYERPAYNNLDARYKFAKTFFDDLANTEPEPEPVSEPV